jgi:tetrahydromethanopterin S-methyltransferase subunit E
MSKSEGTKQIGHASFPAYSRSLHSQIFPAFAVTASVQNRVAASFRFGEPVFRRVVCGLQAENVRGGAFFCTKCSKSLVS